MTTREQVLKALDTLSQPEIDVVAHVMAALRAGKLPAAALDPAIYGPLYRQFAAEDRVLAEQGMSDFAQGVARDDRA